MSEAGNKLVTELIKGYYKFHRGLSPDKVEQREFAFGSFESKIAFRHMAFKRPADLDKYLVDNGPPFVDYSAAYYRLPDARPMEKKEWLGSELRFDIDAGDIVKLPCRLDHGKEWVCDRCLDSAKDEVIKLVENFLIPDFGFSEKELEVNFSGNRGYHVRVRNQSVLSLGKPAREEISNYIFGQGLDYDSFFYTVRVDARHERQMGPRPDDGGWRGKVANAFLGAARSKEDLTSLGIEKSVATKIFNEIATVRKQIEAGNWDFYSIPNRKSVFENLLNRQVINQGNRIDRGVTNEPSHLMRLPNTIHGGTGLVARKLPSMAALDAFEPLRDAIAFDRGEVKVRVGSNYALLLNNQTFGPYKDETLTLPTYAATYLYLKGLADVLTAH